MAKFASLILIDDYPPGMPVPAVASVRDMEKLRELLLRPSLGGFDKVAAKRNPSPAELVDHLHRLAASAARGDLVLVLVAGAGLLDGAGRARLLPGLRGSATRADGVSIGAMRLALSMSRTKRTLLLLDMGFMAEGAAAARWSGSILDAEVGNAQAPAMLASAARQAFVAAGAAMPPRRCLTPWLCDLLGSGIAGGARMLTLGTVYERLRAETPPGERFDVPRLWVRRLSQVEAPLARNARFVEPQVTSASSPRAKDARARSGALRGRGASNWPGRRTSRRSRRRWFGWLERFVGAAVIGPLMVFSFGDATLSELQLSASQALQQAAPGVFRAILRPDALEVFSDPMRSGGRGPSLAVLPGGFLRIGSPASEPERFNFEGTGERVGVEPFAIGVSEVTFDEYDRFARATGRALPDDNGWGRGNLPAINLSWDDARAYAVWLSEQTGQRYALPTEAQWEFAARAGTSTPFETGTCIHTEQANYNGEFDYNRCGARTGLYRARTLPPTAFPPNRWGLYHMHGNVWEWVRDCWTHEPGGALLALDRADDLSPLVDRDCARRIIRGGGWRNEPGFLRSAARVWSQPDGPRSDIGFRVVRRLD